MKDNIPQERNQTFIRSIARTVRRYRYIGQTKTDLETRLKEDFRNIKNEEIAKSAAATHIWEKKHAMDHKPVLLKQASYKQELTNWVNTLKIKQRLHYKF